MIIGIHHAHVTIPKGTEEEGKAFYCGILGLPEIEKPASLKGRGGFWVKAGGTDLHIGTEDGFDRFTTKAHIAYQVDDLPYWRNKLEQHAIKCTPGIPIPGFDRFEFRDPFGNRVEMIQAVLATEQASEGEQA